MGVMKRHHSNYRIISMDKPDKPTKTEYENWGAIEKEDYKMDSKEYSAAERILKLHLMKLHNILWKQCNLKICKIRQQKSKGI